MKRFAVAAATALALTSSNVPRASSGISSADVTGPMALSTTSAAGMPHHARHHHSGLRAATVGSRRGTRPLADTRGGRATSADTPFDSGLLGVGRTFDHTFTRPGTVSYHCTPHTGMTGTVTVVDGSGPTHARVHVGPSGAEEFRPAHVTVRAGGTVHWVWDSGGHSVTRNH